MSRQVYRVAGYRVAKRIKASNIYDLLTRRPKRISESQSRTVMNMNYSGLAAISIESDHQF